MLPQERQEKLLAWPQADVRKGRVEGTAAMQFLSRALVYIYSAQSRVFTLVHTPRVLGFGLPAATHTHDMGSEPNDPIFQFYLTRRATNNETCERLAQNNQIGFHRHIGQI